MQLICDFKIWLGYSIVRWHFWNLGKSLYKILAAILCKCNQIKDVIVFEKAKCPFLMFIAFRYCNFFHLGIAMFLPLIAYVHLLPKELWLIFTCYPRNFDWFSWGWSKNKIYEKKSKWPTQKNWVFKFHQFSIFLAKISGIGPWVSRMNWSKGHFFFCFTSPNL